MEIQEALNWTDDLIFAKTGKHLDSLQRSILEGVWERQEYKDMAENYHCSVDHVRKTASELWKLLSEILGEDVKKATFKSILERIEFSHISNYSSDTHTQIFGDINICSQICPYPKVRKATKNRSHTSPPTTNPTTNQSEKHHDLTEAPEYDRISNRTTEITTLKQWILQENIRLITIFGLPGIGKTALARELVEQIQDKFEYIIWRNCANTLVLKSLQTNLIEFFSKNRETELLSLIDYLRSHSCLIILDDFQELFISGELAGTYLPECQTYGKFLKEIACSSHKTCLLLLSWEKPTEIATLEGENRHCRSLQLGSLGEAAAEILTNKGLTDDNKWGELIELYGGNPSWLNIIASTIEDLFNGSVDRYLSYPSLFLGELEPKLEEYYQRLSASEKQVILWLANQETADIFHKPAELALSDAEFLKAVQSLRKRGVIEKANDKRSLLFAVPILLKKYLQNRYI
ncbi:MAG: NB-ARC domain-containing protein [Phormidium sp.]